MKPDIDGLTEIGGAKILEFLTLTSENKGLVQQNTLSVDKNKRIFLDSQFANMKGMIVFICCIVTRTGMN